jgi:alkylhydroperoxidase family enzyme
VPRIGEVRDEAASPQQLTLFAADRVAYGDVLNTTRVYAHVPELLPPLQALHGALAAAGGLDEALVSLARLRVAGINGCPF